MKDCYIYYLYDDIGIVRYVGRGTKNRLNAKSGRSKEFLDVLNNNGRTEIVVENLSILESIVEENKHIKLHSSTILNKKLHGSYNYLDPEELALFFELSDKSPSGIVWKVDRVNCSNTVKARKGEPAGNIDGGGYWSVPFKGKYVKVHRVVMSLYYNVIFNDPSILINHIDGDKANNSISNLEFSNFRHNAINKTVHPRNSSGVIGVSKYTKRGTEHWKAKIYKEAGKVISKSFSVNVHGQEGAFRLACEWRKQMEELYYK